MYQYYKYNQDTILDMKSNRYFIIIFITLIFLCSLILFCYYFKTTIYINAKLIVNCQNNNCTYYLYLPYSEVNVSNLKIVRLDNKNYPYQIENIEELEIDEKTLNNYQVIQINIDLPKQYQVNNLVLDLKILEREERLINLVKEIIFKE